MKIFVPVLFLATILFGCVRNNPLPVYLQINEWSLESNPLSVENPGALTSNFTDVWVYADNKLIGVFEVPCKIPILISGNKLIRLYPTVRNNGIGATKKIYPFVDAYEITLDMTPGETYSINPTTKYTSSCKFWIEDFESGTIKIETDPLSNAALVREFNSSISLTGDYGHIVLTSSDSLWIGATTDMLNFPQGGSEVYMEIDYRNTNSIFTGVNAIFSSTTRDNPNISINAQDASTLKWKKIYIDLKEIVSSSTNAIGFKPYLRTLISESVGSTDVYIDNIKFVYF